MIPAPAAAAGAPAAPAVPTPAGCAEPPRSRPDPGDRTMPTYQTPGPISAVVDVAAGDVRVNAGHRDDTVVEVRPADESSPADRKAAELTRVEHSGEQVVVKGPTSRSWLGRDIGTIDVSIELPAGSRVYATAGAGDVQGRGPLGTCRIKTGKGGVALESAGTLVVKTGAGDVTVDHASGDVNVSLAQGDVRLGELTASAVVKRGGGGGGWVGCGLGVVLWGGGVGGGGGWWWGGFGCLFVFFFFFFFEAVRGS